MTTSFFLVKWLIIFSYWLLIINTTIQILVIRKPVSSEIAWLLIIYLLPLLGVFIWFFFGTSYLGQRRSVIHNITQKKITNWINHLKKCNYMFIKKTSILTNSLFQLCKNRQGIEAVQGNKLKLLNNTIETVKLLIRDIHLAKKNIEMVFYIWKPGGLADEVASALIKSAKRGIRCRLILDSVGSTEFFRSPWFNIMKTSGIQIVEALKLNLFKIFFRRMDLRQHRKIILIDNYISYTGSMNLVDPFLSHSTTQSQEWVDLMIRTKGPITYIISIIYACDWEIETKNEIFSELLNKKKNILTN